MELEKQELNAKMGETLEQRMAEITKEMIKLAQMFARYAKWGTIFLCLFIILFSIHSLKAKNQEEHMAIWEKLKMTNNKLEQGIQTHREKQLAMEQKSPILRGHFASEKSIQNPIGNYWNRINAKVQIFKDGLNAKNSDNHWEYVFAVQGFDTSAISRKEHFSGTILYYFEVTKMSFSYGFVFVTQCDICEWTFADAGEKKSFFVGLSNGKAPSDGESFTSNSNSYMYPRRHDHCWISGQKHLFERPDEAAKPVEWKPKFDPGDVIGCGLLLSPKNKLSIFFTGNGILLGKPIAISPPSFDNFLYPTVAIWDMSVKANFGTDIAVEPFKYNIDKCPGLVF